MKTVPGPWDGDWDPVPGPWDGDWDPVPGPWDGDWDPKPVFDPCEGVVMDANSSGSSGGFAGKRSSAGKRG